MNWTKVTTPLTDALSQVVGYRESTGHYLTGKLYLREDLSVCVESEDALLCDVSHYALLTPPDATEPDYKELLRLAGELSSAVGLFFRGRASDYATTGPRAMDAKAAYDKAVFDLLPKQDGLSYWPGASF